MACLTCPLHPKHLLTPLLYLAFLVPFLLTSPSARAGGIEQNLMHLLDYVGADYPAAVQDGRILSPGEYAEQQEFSVQIGELIAQLPSKPGKAGLRDDALRLQAAIDGKQPAESIAKLTRGMREDLITGYRIATAPRSAPELDAGQRVYMDQCAGCHGVTGLGDGAQSAGLEPAPTNFRDAGWRAQRSLLGLYNSITLGVSGTAMPAHGHLGDDLRWALSFYVGSLATSPVAEQQGKSLWAAGHDRRRFTELAQVTTPTPADLANDADALAMLAYLGKHPEAMDAGRDGPLPFARKTLQGSQAAYVAGDLARARQLAVTAYLEGFELVEGPLGVRDGGLMQRIERAMMDYRAQLSHPGADKVITAQVDDLLAMLDEADRVLHADTATASMHFFSAFIILLREGLEAILVLAAIAAFLVKTGRRDAMPYLHAGWIGALLLGALTWILASHFISISGTSREITEGIAALVAAAMLIYIGYWLHTRAHAARWKEFIESRIQNALSSRTLWAMTAVSFLAVYREAFETVLFYQALFAESGSAGHTVMVYGIYAAIVCLLALSWLIFRLSVRLPLRWFFSANSLLLYVLAIVFTGKGIAAMQEAGKLPLSPVPFPEIDLLGIYPNALGLGLQAGLVIVATAWVGYRYLANRRQLAMDAQPQ